MTEPKLKVGTDFSGIGAPEQALKNLCIPHDVEFACDKDKYARQTYLANHDAKIMYDDITTRDHAEAPYVDLYCFGFPCQAFSMAGSRKGFDDIRGTLFFNSAEYIKEHRPAVFLAENVKGLLSHDKPLGSKSKHGRTFSTLINLLAKTVNGQTILPMYEDNLGYNVFYTVLNSKYYDVPQNRERIFIVGFRDDVDFKFPNLKKITTKLLDVLEEITEEKYILGDDFVKYCYQHKELHQSRGNGFAFEPRDVNGIASAVSTKAGSRQTDNFVYVREATKKGYAIAQVGDSINLSLPNSTTPRGRIGKGMANTLDTSCNQAVVTLAEMKLKIRRLTPLECMRLQGFPDSFVKLVSDTQIYKQAGNSITVTVLMAIVKNILKAIKFNQ